MAKINVGTPVTAPLVPGHDDTNVWPTHVAKYGQGGFEVVENIAARDAIVEERRADKAVLVRKAGVDNSPALFEYSGGSWNQIDFDDGSGSTNMAFKDDLFTVGDIDTAVMKSMNVQQGGDAGSVVITPYATFVDERTSGTTDEGGQTYVPVEANKISLLDPLQMFSDPDTEMGVVMEIKHDSFEPAHAPGYLAYMGNSVEVLANKGTDTSHKEGMIWPTDLVVDSRHTAIVTNMTQKTVGIQESDGLDPNVTGGSDFLVSYRVSLKGVAPEDGRVTIYLAKGIKFDESSDLVTDVNGETLAAEKHYKAGDVLGDLEVTGVVNAKGLTNISMHVVHTFTSDNIVINERAKGLSGIMIQALSDKGKTGPALLQYELDTRQTIELSRIWLGQKRMSFDGILSENSPKQTGKAGEGISLADGIHFYNPHPASTEVSNGELIISDDGSNICDFSVGKFFDSSETIALRGKQVEVTAEIDTSTNGWNLYLLKWTGTPNKYPKEIYKSRNGGGVPIWEDGWGVGDVKFIAEDVSSGKHIINQIFTVPSDANNYAVVIIPVEAEIPMILKLSKFDLDVVEPFYMYEMYMSNKLDETHLRESSEFFETVQDNQSFAGLRYTITNTSGDKGQPMPCGETHKGRADIVLDPTVNQVVGSSAGGGEGALKFMAEGSATFNTSLRIWSEQAKGTTSAVKFWWVSIAANGAESKIIKSETTFNIPGGSQAVYTMKPFTILVSSGERIALRASADKSDGAFLESTSADKPMLDVKIDFKELLATASDDPMAGLDLSSFDEVFTTPIVVTKEVTNSDSVNIPLDAPIDADIVILSAVKQVAGVTEPVKKLQYSYDKDSKILNVSFGEIATVKLTIGIYTL